MRLPNTFSFLGVSLATLLTLAVGPVNADVIFATHNGYNNPDAPSADVFVASENVEVDLGCGPSGGAGVFSLACLKEFREVATHTLEFSESLLAEISEGDEQFEMFELVGNDTDVAWLDYHIELEGALFIDWEFDEGITVDVSDDDSMLWLFFDEALLPGDGFEGGFLAGLVEATEVLIISQRPSVSGVPEPTTLLLLGLGLAGLGFARRRNLIADRTPQLS